MSYEKPKGLLLATPAKRRTKKSKFLRDLEAKQRLLMHPAAVTLEYELDYSKPKARNVTLMDGFKKRRT